MGKRSGERNLGSLPENEHEFWEGANKVRATVGKVKRCKHHFVYKTSREVRCKHCEVGFFLVPGWGIKEGHIYKGKMLVV